MVGQFTNSRNIGRLPVYGQSVCLKPPCEVVLRIYNRSTVLSRNLGYIYILSRCYWGDNTMKFSYMSWTSSS